MSTRVLPGAYVTLNDLSQYAEGTTSLVVGYALKADRGPVNEAQLVTSASDFLTKYTLDGKPGLSADKTFWSIINVLAHTNQMYVVRAAKDPKFGGVTVKKPVTIGTLTAVVKSTKTFTVSGTTAPAVGTIFSVLGTGVVDGNYTVATATATESVITITTEETPADDFVGAGTVVKVAIQPVSANIDDPASYSFATDDLMLITGIDAGAYNGELGFEITSSVDNTDMVYRKGADIGGTICTFDTMQLTVKIAATNETLETFLFSRDDTAKEIDGTSLSIDNVVNNASAYIQIVNNPATAVANIASNSTGAMVQGAFGSNGDAVDASALATAYNVFADKTIPVSVIGNGCSTEAESNIVQQAILNIVTTRKDCMAFLNSRNADEEHTINSEKAQAIVTYKKETLGSTTYYGCMYAPHVNYTDNINSRQVKIGSDSVALAGWLDIVSGIGYPYAYAGPQNGLVTGVTCDWKIGDESGEASLLNDASVNYIAYDGKVGRYYMQCQNTLQIANSSLRNIGGVLNILDIKEHIATALKEYINLPITDALRRDILANIRGYLEPMAGVRYYNAVFSDVTTESDIAQDTLRFLLTISLTRYSSKIFATISVVNNLFDFSLLQSA